MSWLCAFVVVVVIVITVYFSLLTPMSPREQIGEFKKVRARNAKAGPRLRLWRSKDIPLRTGSAKRRLSLSQAPAERSPSGGSAQQSTPTNRLLPMAIHTHTHTSLKSCQCSIMDRAARDVETCPLALSGTQWRNVPLRACCTQ